METTQIIEVLPDLEVTAEARSRWQTLPEQIQERRRKRHEG